MKLRKIIAAFTVQCFLIEQILLAGPIKLEPSSEDLNKATSISADNLLRRIIPIDVSIIPPGMLEFMGQNSPLSAPTSTNTSTSTDIDTKITSLIQSKPKKLSDGTQLYYEKNQLIREVTPQDDEIFYRSAGGVDRVKLSDQRQILYQGEDKKHSIKILDGAGNVLIEILNPSNQMLDQSKTTFMTLKNGAKVIYEAGELKEIEMGQGIRITDFKLTDQNSFQYAWIHYLDGSKEFIWQGTTLRKVSTDGAITDFLPSGLKVRDIFQQDTQYYEYQKLSQVQIVQTRVMSKTGALMIYDDKGFLKAISGAQKERFYYERSFHQKAGQKSYVISLSDFRLPKGFKQNYLTQAWYSENGQIQKLIFKDKSRIEFKDGRINKVFDSKGKESSYEYLIENGIPIGLEIYTQGSSYQFDAAGVLDQIQTAQGTIERKLEAPDQEAIDILLETVGGDNLTNFELDPSGKILNGILETKDGIKQKIENGKLTGFETVDGKVYELAGSQAILKKWNLQDGTQVLFNGDQVGEIVFADQSRIHGIVMDSQKAITSYSKTLSNGTKIEYGADGLAKKIGDETISYEMRSGAIQKIIFEGENSRREFDAQGELTSIILQELHAELQDQKLKKIRTAFGEIESPQFNSIGVLTGEVKLTDGTKLGIVGGEFAWAIKPDGTRINYEQGKIASIQMASHHYQIHYENTQNQQLQNVKIILPSGSSYSLIPFLNHPEEIARDWFASNPNALAEVNQLKKILLPRSLNSVLEGNNNAETEVALYGNIPMLQTVEDLERGEFFSLSGTLFPKVDDLPEITSEFIDINGDGLPDRVERLALDFWWVQLSDGHGSFKEPMKWTGIDVSSGWASGAIRSYTTNQLAITADILDMNGDHLPDRVFMGKDEKGVDAWFVQINHGQGFNPPVIWRGAIQPFIQMNTEARFSIKAWINETIAGKNFQILGEDLRDVDGDGLPDRLIRPNVAPFDRWFYQKNLGDGFADAIPWKSIVDLNSENSTPQGSLELVQFVPNNASVPSRHAMQIYGNPDYSIGCGGRDRGGCISASNQRISYERNRIAEMTNRSPWGHQAADMVVQFSHLIDMNRDGLLDRVIVDQKNQWYIQWNRDGKFEDPILWDDSVRQLKDAPDSNTASGIRVFQSAVVDNLFADLVDVNGDGLPDRVTVDHNPKGSTVLGEIAAILYKVPSPPFPCGRNSSPDSCRREALEKFWSELHPVLARYDWGDFKPQDWEDAMRTYQGLSERINREQRNTSWWVEINTGKGFAEAVEWKGIEGDSIEGTSIGQTISDASMAHPNQFAKAYSYLKDMNYDNIPDRLVLDSYKKTWNIQFGTGSGFLPIQDMKIESLNAEIETNLHHYDYLHVSLKAGEAISSEQGRVRITGIPDQYTLETMPDLSEAFQEWEITDLGTEWKDFYLPIDKSKAKSAQLKIEFIPTDCSSEIASGTSCPRNDVIASEAKQSPTIYMDDLVLTSMRPSETKDWLGHLLTEEKLLSQIYSQSTQTLSQYLTSGLVTGDDFLSQSWESLLRVETKIQFNPQNKVTQFETLYGTVSNIENGVIKESILPDQTKITFQTSDPHQSQITTQTNGAQQTSTLSYGRVRKVERPGKPALEYSYEYPSDGSEITVIYDPETKMTEKHLKTKLVSRIESDGLTKTFIYDEQDQLIRMDISYAERIRESFAYAQGVQGNRIFILEDGTEQEYDSEGKLLFHTTPDGYRYAHRKAKASRVETGLRTEKIKLPDGTNFEVRIPELTVVPNGGEETIQEIVLSEYVSPEGVKAVYDRGILKSLLLKDGTSIVFKYVEIKDILDEQQNIRLEKTILDVVLEYPDGTLTVYKNGKPFQVTSSSGKTISLVEENGFPLEAYESASFHLAEAKKAWNELVISEWNQFQLVATQEIRSEYTESGTLLARQYSEGTTELYNDQGKVTEIVGPKGELLVLYSYDFEGNPTQIEMKGARWRLDSAVLELKAKVAMEREQALAHIALREEVLSHNIEEEYVVVRERLLQVLREIEAQKNRLTSIDAKGKAARRAIQDGMNQIQIGVDQVHGALNTLASKREEALQDLSEGVKKASQDVETQSQESYQKISEESTKAKRAILKQETMPVILFWYRQILGRDPSSTEYEAMIQLKPNGWLSNQEVLDLKGFKHQLTQSEEYQKKVQEVNQIKAKVEQELLRYLNLEGNSRKNFVEALGADSTEIVAINQESASKILDWLKSRSLHFGQSAYLALEALMQSNQEPVTSNQENSGNRQLVSGYSRVDLASRLILIDILTGTITPFESGDLVISLYAMRKVAKYYGVEAHSLGMNYEALKKMILEICKNKTNCKAGIVLHIDGNHYIVLDEIRIRKVGEQTIEEVVYTDPGAGPENELDQIIITKEEFLKRWMTSRAIPQSAIHNPQSNWGFVLTARAPPQEGQFHLSVHQEMSVRGAFFPFLVFAIMAIVKAIVALVTAIVSAIAVLVNGLIAGISSILGSFGNLFGALWTGNLGGAIQGFFGGIIAGLGEIGGAFINAAVTFQSTLMAGLESMLPTGFLKTTFIGLELQAAGSLLEATGVSPKISRSIMGFGTAAIGVGLLAAGNPLGLTASLGFLSQGASNLLSQFTNLSPVLNTILSAGFTALGAFAGGALHTGSLSGAFEVLKSSTPFLSVELASAGMVSVGDALGLDPRLTGLLNIPVRAAVGSLTNGLVNGTGYVAGYRDDGSSIIVSSSTSLLDYVKDSVFSSDTFTGLLSVGAGIALGEVGVPVLAQNVIGGFMQGLGSTTAGKEIFSSISDGVKKFGSVVKQAVGNVIGFGREVLGTAANITAEGFRKGIQSFSSIFSPQTQENIYKDASGIQSGTFTSNGDTWTWQNGDSRIEYNHKTNQLTDSFGVGGKATIEGLSKDSSGNYFYDKITYEKVTTDGTLTQNYQEGFLTDWNYESNEGIQISGEVDKAKPATNGFENGKIVIDIPGVIDQQAPTPNFSFSFNIFNNQIAEASVEAEVSQNSVPVEDKRLDKTLYVATNGIGYDDTDFVSAYMENFREDLVEQSNVNVNPLKDVIIAPTFAISEFLKTVLTSIFGESGAFQMIQKMKDVWDLLRSQGTNRSGLVFDLRKTIKDLADVQGIELYARESIGIGYSGGFAPIVRALTNGEFSPKAFVALGGATLAISSELAQALVNVVENYENLITLRNDTVRMIVNTAVGVLSAILKEIAGIAASAVDFILEQLDSWYNVINKEELDSKVAKFYRDLKTLLASQLGYNWGGLTNSNADLIVNIYGSKDPLTIGNLIMGHLDELGGYKADTLTDPLAKPLFNIEIEGANHFDYINGVAHYTNSQDILRNDLVSKYVSQLILNSDNPEKFRIYLDELIREKIAIKTGVNDYRLNFI